jgi:uncharacterized protein YggU (UPF0235/DUF167 family)
VGGRWGPDDDPALLVHVRAPAADGRANAAVAAALADAFGVRRAAVRIVSGATSRSKVVDIDGVDAVAVAALVAREPAGPRR